MSIPPSNLGFHVVKPEIWLPRKAPKTGLVSVQVSELRGGICVRGIKSLRDLTIVVLSHGFQKANLHEYLGQHDCKFGKTDELDGIPALTGQFADFVLSFSPQEREIIQGVFHGALNKNRFELQHPLFHLKA